MDKNERPQGWNVIDGGKKSSASKNFRDQQKVPISNSSDQRTSKSSSTNTRSSGHRNRTIRGAKSPKGKKFKGKILSYLLAASIALGGINVTKHIYNNIVNPPINFKQAEQAMSYQAISYDDLGISENTVNNLKNLEAQLDSGDLSLNDLINLGEDLKGLELEIVEDKLAQALGVDATAVNVDSNPDSSSSSLEKITVTTKDGQQIYLEDDFFNSLGPNNTFSQKIADFIIDTENTVAIGEKIKSGKLNYEEGINAYKEQIQNTFEFAASVQIVIKGNGNIATHVIRQNSLPKNSQEESLLKDDDDLEL